MPKHYLKFSTGAAGHIQQIFAFSGDPTQAAFDDLTAQGQRINFANHAPTEAGPCIELHGTRCHALAGPNSRQVGVLLIFNIRDRPFSVDPGEEYLGSFALWDAHALPGDSVSALFRTPTAPTRPPISRSRYVASSELQQFFATVPQSVRRLYWPRVSITGPLAVHVANASRAWRKHGLDTLALPTRGSWQEAILRGSASITPTQQNAAGIWPLFDLVLLDRFVSSVRETPASDTRFHALLHDVASLPLSETQRSRLWFHLIAQCDAESLVQDVAAFASAVASLMPPEQEVWGRAIDDAVREISRRSSRHDALHLLKGRLDLADAQDLAFGDVLSDWAKHVMAPPGSAEQAQATPTPGPAGLAPTVPLPEARALLPGNAASEEPISDIIEQWVLAMLGSDNDTVQKLRDGAQNLLQRLNDVSGVAAPSLVLQRLSEQAEPAQRTVEQWRILPSVERVVLQRAACHAAASKASAAIPPSLFAEMLQGGLDPDAVLEIVELCEHDGIWRAMPEWWWASTVSGDVVTGDGPTRELWIRAFMQVRTRRLARFASKLIMDNETVKANLSLLATIPAPEHGIEPDRHLEHNLRELAEIRTAVQRLEDRFPKLVALRVSGMPTQELVTLGTQVTALSEWFSTACLEQITAEVSESPGLASARLRAYEKKLSSLQPLLSQETIRMLPIAELRKGLELERRDDRITALPFEIAHALVPSENGGSRAARLAFRPFDDNHEFGTVAIPISIKAASTRPARLQFRYSDFTDPDLRRWPESLRNRAQILPAEVVELLEADWTKMPGVDKWQHSVICYVPLRQPMIDERVTLRVSVRDAETGAILGTSNKLEWTVSYVPSSDANDPRPEIPLHWSEGINVEYARNHPVGPQKHTARMLDRINAGDSFAVVAPRRFGKSTLIEHLQSLLKETRTPTATLVCADFRVPGSISIDHRRLWQRVAEMLPVLVPRPPHIPLTFDTGSPPLPTAESFDALRQALHESQKAGAVVFLDEAHLLFAGGNPVEYSSRLRTLLSTRLSRRDPDKAPLMFAFFGVPTMSAGRMGELWPYLNPIRDHSLDDDELHRLARQFTNGRLEITREARERIVALSSNLLILQRVLRRVRDYVQKQFRTCVVRQDVVRVEEEFKQELLRGEDPESVRRYLLDILNEAVDLESWRPSTAYPLALALAVAHSEKYRGDEARTFAQVQLASWAGVLFKDKTSLPSFDDPASSAEHFQTLAELDIYRAGRFTSEFLECTLAGSVDSTQLPTDPQFSDTLLRAGVATVRLPRDRVFVARGGQAEVFRSLDLNLAIRTTPIESPEERDRFLGRLSLFDVVRKLERGNDPRTAHIMRLRDAGLADVGGATCAVQTYDWIDGETLDERTKKAILPARVVVQIGQQIASALTLLHEHGVWHRDVCPRNIVLQENLLFAVLIDFGFATFSNRGRTALATDDAFPAPEVRLKPPQWSAGADVFSLAKTIESLLPSGVKEAVKIRRALQPFITERFTERGSLSALILALERIERELNTRGVIRQFQDTLLKLVQDESLNAVLRRRERDLDGFALGLYAHHGERCAKIANLINQVAEYKRRCSIGEWLHDVHGADRHPDELRIYVALRNTDSHGSVDLSNTRFARHWNDPRALILQGVGALTEWLGIPELSAIVQFLLAAEARPA